jgi:hypothetical protein
MSVAYLSVSSIQLDRGNRVELMSANWSTRCPLFITLSGIDSSCCVSFFGSEKKKEQRERKTM